MLLKVEYLQPKGNHTMTHSVTKTFGVALAALTIAGPAMADKEQPE
jgi:hypothetical protein